MLRSTEENARRKAIMEKAIRDAVAFLDAGGYHLTPEQAALVQARLGPQLAELNAHEPTEALDLLSAASVLDIVAQVLGIIADVDPVASAVAFVLELCVTGGEHALQVLKRGGYLPPTDSQRQQIVRAIRLQAQTLAENCADLDRARAAILDSASKAVSVVMGDAPNRPAFLN